MTQGGECKNIRPSHLGSEETNGCCDDGRFSATFDRRERGPQSSVTRMSTSLDYLLVVYYVANLAIRELKTPIQTCLLVELHRTSTKDVQATPSRLP